MTRRLPTPADPPSPLRAPSGESIPLRSVAITGEVIGGHARLTSTQRYRHDEPKPLEAVYTFPLPSDAAVTGFAMEVAGRRLEARVEEREEAFRAYDDALTSGHGAALVEQERANVFTANVGNLLPGEDVTIAITFVMKVPGDEGALRLAIPTLVAPRYIPGAIAGDRTAHGAAEPTDLVPDADRISPRVGVVDFTLSLDLALHFDANARLSSPSHAITSAHDGAAWRVTLEGAPLDRDLVLLVEPEERASLERVVAHRDPDAGAGFVVLSLVPELARLAPRAGTGGVFSFVVDRSGSMGGSSIEEARRALRLCLRQLREGDRFEVIAFDDRIDTFRAEPVPYTERTLAEADRWIAGVEARGGTELRAPLVRAAARGGVVVLLTDGQVGNEDQILADVLAASRDACIYTFGIGTNVSDVLLGELARRTGGAMELIYPGERIDEKVVATFAKAHALRVARPVVRVSGVELDDLAPSRLPDLVDGEPWSLMARYARGGRTEVRLEGTLGGQPFVHVLIADLPDRAEAPLVPTLWARERVRDLEAHEVTGRRAAAMKDRIVLLAKEHGLASRYTSFVVVEKRTGERRVTEPAETRAIPVSAPHGWAMFDRGVPSAVTVGALAAGAVAVGAVATRGGQSFSKRKASAGGRAPAPASARRRVTSASKDALYSSAPPMPAPMPARASVPAAPSRAEPDHEDELSMADTSMDFLGGLAAPSPSEGARRESPFERQRASGLWDDAEHTLAATIDALRAILTDGITTSHAIYGANARKAVDAVVLAAARAILPRAEREEALLLAYLVASGRKSRALVRDAIEAHAPEAAPRLTDESALRRALLG